jgi:hypothetical protein
MTVELGRLDDRLVSLIRFTRASEVQFQLKSGQPVANSGPGVRAEPTPSLTAGRKPEAGPPSLCVSTGDAPSLTLKVGQVGDCKGGGWNPPPLACSRASHEGTPDPLQACLTACNMRPLGEASHGIG